MIEYTETKVERPSYIICNKCGKKRPAKGDDTLEVYEFVQLRNIGGYGSEVGDGVEWELDLCESCFLELCGDYLQYNDIDD